MPSPRFEPTFNWTPELDAQVAALYAEGWNWEEVGQITGTSRVAAYHRARKIGVAMRPRGRIPGVAYGQASHDRINRSVDGKPQTFARFACHSCSETLDIPLLGSMGAHGYAKEAEKRGWEAHPLKRAKVLCPKCRASRPANDPDSELKKVLMNGTSHANVTPLQPPVREITAEERVKIRSMLDKYFDDGVGCYADDWSDEKIAVALNLPRAAIERLREAAYGPIRVDPIMSGFRAELAQAKRDLEASKNSLAKLESQLMSLGSRIEKRMSGKP